MYIVELTGNGEPVLTEPMGWTDAMAHYEVLAKKWNATKDGKYIHPDVRVAIFKK